MPRKIPKAALAALAQKARENPDKLRNLTFADATTATTAVKTQDLRLDVHKSTKNLNMATGIIQANSEAKDKTVKDFIGGSTGSHKGTHQIIGEKIGFGLGNALDIEAVASVIEKGGVSGDIFATQNATGDTTTSTLLQSDWNWSAENAQYYRQKSDGASMVGEISGGIRC